MEPYNAEQNGDGATLKKLEELQLKIKKRDEENQKLIKTLTGQVVAVRTEVRQMKSVEADLSQLRNLPFLSLDAFKDFHEKLLCNEEMKNQVKHLIYRIGGNDMASFQRMAVKTIISHELAVHLTWRETSDKPSIQNFNSFNIIKDACHSKYQTSSFFEINKVCQQHFLHAKERVNKRQKLYYI